MHRSQVAKTCRAYEGNKNVPSSMREIVRYTPLKERDDAGTERATVRTDVGHLLLRREEPSGGRLVLPPASTTAAGANMPGAVLSGRILSRRTRLHRRCAATR